MAGIIQGAQDSQAVPQEQAPPAAGPRQVKAQAVRGQMAVPPELRGTYDKLVMAGKKILFSEQMTPEIQALMDGEGDTGTKIGMGVVGLMALLVGKANGTFPPQLIIPVAAELVAEAGDLLEEAGGEVSDQDVAEGMAVMVQEILQRAGVSPEQIPGLLQGGGAPQGAQPSAQQGPQVAPDGKPIMET